MSGAVKVMPCFRSIQPYVAEIQAADLRNLSASCSELEAYLEEYP